MTIYQAAAADYRQRLGWAAVAHGTVVWMAPGYQVEALHVPAEVGRLALDRLREAGTEPPVIVLPGPPNRWTMLTRPHDGPVTAILNLFSGHDEIGYAYGGGRAGRHAEWGIDLPPSRFLKHGPLRWLTPDDTPLLPLDVVADAVRAVIIG